MPRRKEPARVVGPYEEDGRWRLVVISNGKRENHFSESWSGALRLLAKLRRQVKKRSEAQKLGDVLEQFRQARLAQGKAKPETVEHQHKRLSRMFEEDLAEPIDTLTTGWALALYAEHIERIGRNGRPLAAATQHLDVHIARGFFKWAQRRGVVSDNPFAAVELVGRANCGKQQLRISEARTFSETALVVFQETGQPLALGALLALWLGLRSGEILGARVRDVDDAARVLWVERGKTKNARRHLVVPEPLRPVLIEIARGRPAGAPLLASAGELPYSRSAFGRAVLRICKRAGVPGVCVHALRGTHATLAMDAGATSLHVAAALGHTSFAITAKHYVAPGTAEEAQARQVATTLVPDPNRSGNDPAP